MTARRLPFCAEVARLRIAGVEIVNVTVTGEVEIAGELEQLHVAQGQAIERALAHVGRVRAPQKPIGLLSDYERTRFYAEAQRQRTMAVWALQQAERVRERDYSYAQRQEEMRQLRNADDIEREHRAFARPRLRPYAT